MLWFIFSLLIEIPIKMIAITLCARDNSATWIAIMSYFLTLFRSHFLVQWYFLCLLFILFLHFKNDFLMFRMNNFQCSVKQIEVAAQTHFITSFVSVDWRHSDRFNRLLYLFNMWVAFLAHICERRETWHNQHSANASVLFIQNSPIYEKNKI